MVEATNNGTQARRSEPEGSRLALLVLAALGVVYGDIGTSPLYAIRECFYGEFGIEVTRANVLGVPSLMIWSLILIVCVKYLTFMLRADNEGEGGVIALTALVRKTGRHLPGRSLLVALGLFAACLLYGDGMITPAISVLSAVEGLSIVTPVFDPWVVPTTVAILVLLFAFQRRGTVGVGVLFGPVTLVWLIVLAVLGVRGIALDPHVLTAFDPRLGISFLVRNRLAGFLVLGAVFLVVTGAEALYADLGHFGRRPIRIAWYSAVLPALLLNYLGQSALLLGHPEHAHHPFYALAPEWAVAPLVGLATAATIIASQAVISGAFSMTRQAIQLGFLPRLRIVHTSSEEIGQIYVPAINLLLAVSTIGLVLGFGSSSRLAAAYGVAVTSTMLISSILLYVVAHRCWGWSRLAAAAPVAVFLVVDITFFSANISKLAHGAWFPLVIGAVAFTMMRTWQKGRRLLAAQFTVRRPTVEEFLAEIRQDPPARVQRKAVFMTSDPKALPPALLHNLKHNRVLHSQIALLTITIEEVPRMPRDEKVTVEDLGDGFQRVRARLGYMESPRVPYILALAGEKGLDIDLDEASFFLGRERVLSKRRPRMPEWQRKLFAFMSRNAVGPTAFFEIPPNQVVELGAQVEL